MNAVNVADLKARLSAVLRKVKSGQEMIVTERGVPVARIVPLAGDAGHERRQGLAAEGVLRPGRGRARRMLLAPPPGPRASGAAVLAALLEERREGR